jgi:cell division protein YceG involved in septum cleavage
MKTKRYDSLFDYCKRTGVRKVTLASELGISRFKLAGLLYPDRYPVSLTDDIVTALAALLNRSESYVRDFYEKAAA